MKDVLAVELLQENVGKPLLWMRRLFTWKLMCDERLLVVSLLHHRLIGSVEIFYNAELKRRTGFCAFCATKHAFTADGLEFGIERFASGFMLRVNQVPFENLTSANASTNLARRSEFLPLLALNQLNLNSTVNTRPQNQNWFDSEIKGLDESLSDQKEAAASRFFKLENSSR